MLRTAVTIVLFAALITGLVGQLGEIFPGADAVNHFAPIWSAIGFAAAVIALVYRAGRTHAVAVTAAALGLLGISMRMIAPEYLARASAVGGHPGTDLTLIQFNAMIDNPDPDAAADWIIAQHADVVTIDEARQAGEIRQRLRQAYPFQTGCLDHDRCSTAVLTRQAPLAIVPLAHGDPDNRGGLSAIGVVIAPRGVPTLVIATHFNRPWPFGGYDRSLRSLAEELRGVPRMPTVLAGDFNMTPWTFAMAQQDRSIRMRRVTRALPTWPATLAPGVSLPLLPIDHVYVRGLRALRITRGPAVGSDHLALRLELAFDTPVLSAARSPDRRPTAP